jgi:hypothetical protein
MNRVGLRALWLVTLSALGLTTLAAVAAGGCAFTGNGDPVASVCNAIGGYLQTCKVSSSCEAAFVRDCSKFSTSVSASTVNALFDCYGGPVSCGGATSALTSTCFDTNFAGEFSSAQPTAAQTLLAHDYCHACAPEDPTCGQILFLPRTDAGVPPGGGAIYSASDTTLQAVDSTCIPGLPLDAGAACAETFTKCAAPIVAAGIYLPSECIVSGYTATGDPVGAAAVTDAGEADTGLPDAG